MRFLADIPDDDVKWLDRKAAEEGKSRAAIVREAIARYRAEAGNENDDWLDQAFGLWKRHGFSEDGVGYQRRLRAEWSRSWEPEPGDGDG